jgi:predicted component of type VI protein secretion system
MLAGVKGSLQALLNRLHPSAIEAGVQKPSFLPGAHRAAVWAAYLSAHGQLCEEAASDCGNVVSQGFGSAYQRETNALSNAEPQL